MTALMEILLRRRSHRSYDSEPVTAEAVEYVLDCVHRFQRVCAFTAPGITIVARGPEFDRIVRVATSGIIGLINPWLGSTRASHLILCTTRYPDRAQDVPLAIKQAAICMQVAVLAATELGYGTCWMAGVHHERIEQAVRFGEDEHLIAISPLGRALAKPGLNWDSMAHQVVSKRRRPVGELWLPEVWR